MNNMLPRPRFWAEAAVQIQTRRSLFAELLIYLLLTLIGYLGQALIISVPVSGWLLQTQSDAMLEELEAGQSLQRLILSFMEDLPEWVTVVSLFGGVAMGAATVFYCLKFQKRKLSSMGLRRKGWALELVLGLILGTALVCAVIGLGAAVGGFRLTSSTPSTENLGLVLLSFLGCIVSGASLELLTRGYFAPTVGARAPVAVALFYSTFASVLMQAGGSLFSLPVANHLLFGVFLGVLVLKRGNLWSACAIHSAWLFAENFLFNVAPAGKHGGIRLFEVDADTFRPVLSGGAYGISNSICTTIVLLAAVAVILALPAKDPAPIEPEQTAEEEQHSNFL